MSKKFDIVAKVGTYKDKQGQDKTLWKTLGAVIEGEKGPFIVIERSFNLAALADKGDGKAYLSLFEPKEQEARPSQSSAPARRPAAGGPDDEPPW